MFLTNVKSIVVLPSVVGVVGTYCSRNSCCMNSTRDWLRRTSILKPSFRVGFEVGKDFLNALRI